MALATPTISYVDGTGNASVNLAANATAYVTPSNALAVSLQSTTGVVQADWVIVAPGTPLDGYRPPRAYSSPFSFSVGLPAFPMSFTLYTEVFDGNNITTNANVFNVFQKTAGQVHRARGVVTVNESLTAFDSVTGGTIRDGVTYAQGDVVLLVAQSSASQNGLYYVGAVASGSAPLTRVPDYATGTVFSAGQPQVVELGPDGTVFGLSTWKLTTTGAVTVDTTNTAWLPRTVKGTQALSGGAATVSNLYVGSLAQFSANDTTAANAVKGVLTAGGGSGSLALTGTTTDTISYVITNW